MSHIHSPTSEFYETNPHFITRERPQGGAPPQEPHHHVPQQVHYQPEHSQQQPRRHVQLPQLQPHQDREHTPQHLPDHQRHAQPFGQRPQQQPHDDSSQHPHHPVLVPLPEHQRVRHAQPFGQRPEQQYQSPDMAHQNRRYGPHGLRVPPPRHTKPFQWFLAIFCAIFWLLIILAGLIVLTIYLVYRPQSPRFELSSVTLNAAYLDMGYLLNADVTILANFSNPNKKVSVDLSYLTLNLYYEDTLIATRYIEPFSASKKESKFAEVHMVTSQVRLSVKNIKLLKRQIQSNNVKFHVKGFFRTRSNLGSFLKYSYWLYGHCTFVVTGPPSGVLVSKRCRTKR